MQRAAAEAALLGAVGGVGVVQVEHDTEEFHRATQEQNGLKQQYIELLEAMGVPVTDELLGVRAQLYDTVRETCRTLPHTRVIRSKGPP